MPTAGTDVIQTLRGAPTIRLVALAALALLLQAPILLISALIGERQSRRDAAVADVSAKWGFTQRIAGPVLVVPYVSPWTGTPPKGEMTPRTDLRHAVFLPARLRVSGTVNSEVRHRGIFTVPIYTFKGQLDGEFASPGFTDLGVEPASIAWQRAVLAVGISDVRAIAETTTLQINEATVPFQAGTAGLAEIPVGIRAPIPINAATPSVRFSIPLALNGSVGLYLAPLAEETTVELTSNSPHPNFQGNWLPIERTVTERGFRARWTIPSLGRNYPQAWLSTTDMRKLVDDSYFGVDLIDPVDEHRMAARSVKYAGLFIVLTFGTVWLIEVLAGVRVHPIQYVLLGAALCLFYLLELSLAEHLTFVPAYALASAGVVALVTMYGASILGSARRAGLVGLGVTGLYGYLFVLLTNEDSALLVGSLGLFAILAAIMFVTRQVDWYGLGERA
jgi:inner membrane protein